jgi:sigma-B regulation protein RsbU (phosphoserine phosphatase)
MLVDRVPGTRISLALVYPAHEVMAPAWRLTWKLGLLTLAGMLVLGLVVVHISRSIVRPITALASTVRQVAAGDLEHELPPPSSEDEVGQLEEAFGQMLQDLRRHIDELTRTTAAKERMETELKLARDLQHSILPRIVPSFQENLRIDLAARCTPAREVGGDFYDFFDLGQEHFGFVLGDVSDKGMAAALYAALAQALVSSLASRQEAPGDCLTRVNRLLSTRNERLMFVTLFYGILDTRTGRVRYANAGHNPPYLVRAGKVTPVSERSGMALGVCADETYQTFEMTLAPGEGLMIYSDGVTEAMDVEGRLFSEERLEGILEQTGLAPASAAVQRVVEEVERFSQGAGPSDDMTLLALRYLGRATEGLRLTLRGVLEELPRVHRELGEFAARHRIPESVLHDVHVALEEVLTNLVTYGSAGGTESTIDLQAFLEGQVLTLVVEDDTPSFDPLEVTEPDVTAELADRPVGGLGLLLVRELMDSVHYEQREGRNRLTLTRRLEGG